MKLLLLFLALPAFGQVTFSAISSNSVTDRTARVNATLSAAATVFIQFGESTSYGSRMAGGNPGTTNVVVDLVGLQPNTTIHYRLCQTGFSPPTGCSSDQTLATTSPATFVPTPPTAVDVTYPASFTTTYTVASDCSDLQSKITTASGQDGNNNYLVSIPAGTTCGGAFTLPVKTGANPNGTGTIVVASDGTLPPAETRIDTSWPTAQLVTMLQSTVQSGFPWTSDPATCIPLYFQWRTDLSAWKMCNTTNTWTLVSAQPGWTTGASAPAGACTAGRYYERTGVARFGLYYCHAVAGWVNVSTLGNNGYTFAAPEIFDASVVTGYRMVGFYFKALFENYSDDNTYVRAESGSNRIIVDRCVMMNQRTSAGGNAFAVNGANIALINSYVSMVPWSTTPAINITAGTGPFFFQNNYLSGCFATVFANDNDNTVPRSDFTFNGNWMTLAPECNPTSPSYDGRTYVPGRDTRAVAEFKRGTRISFNGNIFDSYWTYALANGSAVIFTPRATNSTGGDDNAYQISDVNFTNNIFRTGTGGIDVWGSDDQWYRNTRMTSRFNFSNNLAYNLNGNTLSANGAVRGPWFYVQDGIYGLNVSNNTWYNAQGTGPAIVTFTNPFGGYTQSRNIMWINQGGVTGGDDGGGVRWANGGYTTLCDGSTTANTANATTKLNKCGLNGTYTYYDFTNNAIVGGQAGYTASYQPVYPTGNLWPGDTASGIAALSFTDTSASNYRLKFSSSYAPLNVGADQDVIRAATGESYNLRALSITSSGATVYWTAPDATTACTIEYGTSATYGTGARVTDTPTSRFRSKALTGLTTGTLYYFRTMCAGQIASSSFTTS